MGYAYLTGGRVGTLGYVWDVGLLAWVPLQQPILQGATVTIGAVTQGPAGVSPWLMAQPVGQGQTLHYLSISQGAPGTTTLVAGGAKAIAVVNYVIVLDADGTCKFTDGVSDLSGALPIAAKGGVSAPGQPSSPWLVTPVGSPLTLVTTGGKAFGHLGYFLV